MENFRLIEQPPNTGLKTWNFAQKFHNIKGKKLAGVHLSIWKKFFWTTLIVRLKNTLTYRPYFWPCFQKQRIFLALTSRPSFCSTTPVSHVYFGNVAHFGAYSVMTYPVYFFIFSVLHTVRMYCERLKVVKPLKVAKLLILECLSFFLSLISYIFPLWFICCTLRWHILFWMGC